MAIVIWSGLVLGAIYALVALGFTLTLIPTGVFNFAQGAIVIGGSFLMYQWLARVGIPMGPALLLNLVIGAAVGLISELVTVRPLRWRGRELGASTIVTTVGFSTLLIGVYGVKWGYEPLSVPFHGPSGNLHVLGVVEQPVEVITLALAVVAALVLQAWFSRTRTGRACLAVAEDRDAAQLRGINVNLLSLGAFAVAGAFGGITGALTGPTTYAIPTLGSSLALGGFVALALGGEGSFLGSLLGGLVVGLVSALATRYVGASWDNLSVLIVLLVVLIARPSGLAGVAEGRRV